MSEDYPPIRLSEPSRGARKKVKVPPPQVAKAALSDALDRARSLAGKVQGLSQELGRMTASERRAVFYKLSHSKPIASLLAGTGLRCVYEKSSGETLAIPKYESLDKLSVKIARFERSGKAGFARDQAWVALVTDIEKGKPLDRLSRNLQEELQGKQSGDLVVLEVEMFSSLERSVKRQKAEISQWLEELKSQLWSRGGVLFEHEMAPPTCRAVIRCPKMALDHLIYDALWVERIRFMEERPRFATYSESLREFSFGDLAPIESPPVGAPTICVIDSGVSCGNPFLDPVVRRDAMRSYLPEDADVSDGNGHGSAVASLAAYYALIIEKGGRNVPAAWIASGRILNGDNQLDDSLLLGCVIDRVVADFVREGVRIFCLSVCDTTKIWCRESADKLPRKSWVARKIDQLSRRHDILFIIPTGNIAASSIEAERYPDFLLDPASRMLDPAQAALAITVGGLARPVTVMSSADAPIGLHDEPAPFTRAGPGMRGERKPELVEYAGNLAFDAGMQKVRSNIGLQVPVASRGISPALAHDEGTSLAAPRVANKAARVVAALESNGARVSMTLVRALLVNSAIMPRPVGDRVHGALGENVGMVFGYGVADVGRATGGDDYSVVMTWDGSIMADEVLFFRVPIPAGLVESNGEKRISVTVACAPEVQTWGLQRYFGADIEWRMFRGDVNDADAIAALTSSDDESDIDTGASEDTGDEGGASEMRFDPGVKMRSRGAVQHAEYVWTRHKEAYSSSDYLLAVACRKRWQRKVEDMPLAVVVRVEDSGRQVRVYGMVAQALQRVRARM